MDRELLGRRALWAEAKANGYRLTMEQPSDGRRVYKILPNKEGRCGHV